ncbi:solute carrier organic anion transporter family member 5A1 [Galendromus occidentalis]|uniref:Solute carrier organic anion transporter family member 5A1 n=1 Tax=Galendromus occidentalis TaxID=34638 RepID=A0AAJ7WIZ3_9ACAR|nr:solute carrier organic anion transporter family member 5A1 [Galendromus occidentalis]
MADNLGPILFSALIGYLSAKGNRPRWAAGAMVMAGVSSMLGAMPYFIYGPVASVYYSAGTSYLDDSVSKKHAPTYMTITAFMRGIGPILGFLLSSYCLQKYEEPEYPPDYDHEDPRWIGAWWMGFAILSFFMIFFSVPLLLFPKKMRRPGIRRKSYMVSDIYQNTLRLIMNPIYTLHLCSQVFKWFGIMGYFNYMQKYLQEQFRVSASDASLYGGAVPLLVALLTTSLGGVFVRYVKPRPKTLTFLMFICEVVTVLLFASLLLYSCEPPDYTQGPGEASSRDDMFTRCNANCSCSSDIFHPVCIGSTTYFSPCFAGCRANSSIVSALDPTIDRYENCECAKYHLKEKPFEKPLLAVEGRCNEETPECTRQFMFYIITLTSMYCLAFLLQVAHILLPMRCVDKEDKTFALGVFEGVCCLFAFIPYPFAYSAIIDYSCIFWEQSCNQFGNCWIYDLSRLNKLLHGMPVITCIVNCVCMFGIYLLANDSKLARFYDDEIDDDDEDGDADLYGTGERDVKIAPVILQQICSNDQA